MVFTREVLRMLGPGRPKPLPLMRRSRRRKGEIDFPQPRKRAASMDAEEDTAPPPRFP